MTVELAPDGAHPNCQVVSGDQRFRVTNRMYAALHTRARVARLYLPGSPEVTLVPGQTLLYDLPFAAFMAKGQHFIPGVAEFWLN